MESTTILTPTSTGLSHLHMAQQQLLQPLNNLEKPV